MMVLSQSATVDAGVGVGAGAAAGQLELERVGWELLANVSEIQFVQTSPEQPRHPS